MDVMADHFDPSWHRVAPARWFDDFKLGERFVLPSRTIGDASFAAFQMLSGDNHPIHYDIEYCRRRGFTELLAHGFQVTGLTAAGAGMFPHMMGDASLGFISQTSTFLLPVFRGDTLYPELIISALLPRTTTGVIVLASKVHNQHGARVLEGEQRYLVRRRPANGKAKLV